MPASSASPNIKPRRWYRLRFSLRTFFILLTLLCVTAGWFINRCETHRKTVADLENAGYYVEVSCFGQRKMDVLESDSFADWRFYFFGQADEIACVSDSNVTDEHLILIGQLRSITSLVRLDQSARNVTERGLRSVANLSELESLTLRDVHFTDEGLALVAQNKQLRELNLFACRLSPKGLAPLTALTELHFLDLNDTPLTNDAAYALPELPELRSLRLSGTGISERGLDSVGHCRRLQILKLADNLVTDVGLANLAAGDCDSIFNLDLSNNPVGNDGVSKLTRWPHLTYLSLRHTNVTDVVLPSIASLAQLKVLDLSYTDVSDQGLRAMDGMTADIERLNLEGPRITDEGLHYLRPLLLRTTPVVILPAEGVKFESARKLQFETKSSILVEWRSVHIR